MRRPAVWGACGLAALAALYLSLPDKLYVFDGVMFAGIIERGVDDWRAELFNRRHLLFNPLMMGIRDLFMKLGLTLSGYDAMQRVNAVSAALGVGLFFWIVKKTTRDGAVAACAAFLLAVSATYWSRAVEGQVYLLMTLGALISLAAFLRLLEAPGPGTAAAAAFAVGAATLLHAVDAVLVVPAAAAFYLAGRRAALWGAGFMVLSGLWVLISFAAVFHLAGVADFLNFFLRASEYFSPGKETSFGGLAWRFFHTDSLGLTDRAALIFDEAGTALTFHVGRPWVVLEGAVLAGGAFLAGRSAFREKADRPAAAVLLCFGLAFILENAFWLGGVFFWAPPVAAFLALAAIPAARRLRAFAPARRRAALGFCGGAALALAVWNFAFGILPQSRVENNAGYRGAKFVEEHTVPTSWVVISGFGAFANSKVYLPYFAHRSRQALELYFDRNPKEAAVAQVRDFLQENMKAGVPIYMLSDLVEDPEVNRQLLSRWGLSVEELRSCFGPGSVLPLARSPEGLGIYLFEPKGRLPELFTGLGYAALTDDDGPRLSETVGQLKVLAGNMTPPERRAAGALLKSSDYGAGMLMANFSRYTDAESQGEARRRLELFHRYQKTGVFHLRLGGFFHLLGLTADQNREWAEAARLSKNPAEARRLLKVP